MNKAEKIWNEYSRLMLYIARGFFGDTPDAEDAVSERLPGHHAPEEATSRDGGIPG